MMRCASRISSKRKTRDGFASKEIWCQFIILGEIQCQFIILARKGELTPDFPPEARPWKNKCFGRG